MRLLRACRVVCDLKALNLVDGRTARLGLKRDAAYFAQHGFMAISTDFSGLKASKLKENVPEQVDAAIPTSDFLHGERRNILGMPASSVRTMALLLKRSGYPSLALAPGKADKADLQRRKVLSNSIVSSPLEPFPSSFNLPFDQQQYQKLRYKHVHGR